MTACSRWKRPTLVAWLAICAAVIILSGLAVWQVARLGEKEALAARIAESARQPASLTLPYTETALWHKGWSRYRVTGAFLHEHEMHLAARYHRGALGYHILTPFRLTDGRMLLVNRGWVAAAQKEAETRPGSQPEGQQDLTVMLRTDKDRNYFTPDHDIKDNIWFWRDIAAMATHTGLDLLPVPADAVVENPLKEMLPIPSDGHIVLRNDHLGYAITWFLLDIAAIIIFILYHRRTPA